MQLQQHSISEDIRGRPKITCGTHGRDICIINSHSKVPEDWGRDGLTNVLPRFRKGHKEKLVSLTSMVDKLLEGILRERMYMLFEKAKTG